MPRTDKAVTVLVIDDSAFNRESISKMLSGHPRIKVVGTAADGNAGLREVMALQPDVITLDLEMPRMDGYTFLRILMTRKPTPVVVISSHSARESVFKALELGAVDFLAKPARQVAPELDTIRQELIDKVLGVGRLKPVRLRATRDSTVSKSTPIAPSIAPAEKLLGLVCIGSSTGGPPALKELFEALPGDLPVAILVSQHMPASFTGPFARRLNNAGPMQVREAQTGDILEAGLALVAPGHGSLVVRTLASGALAIHVERPEESVPRVRIAPNADIMMSTAVAQTGKDTLGIVLTGMGDDGSRGVVAIRDAGGATVAEAESSAIIYGMPEAAVATGAIDQILPLDDIAVAIIGFAQSLPR